MFPDRFLQELPLDVEIGHQLLQRVVFFLQHARFMRTSRACLAVLPSPSIKRGLRDAQLPAHCHQWRACLDLRNRLPDLIVGELARSHRFSVSPAEAVGLPGAITRTRRTFPT